MGQELGQDLLLLLGQVLGPVPPDQARGVLVGLPHGPWCLCCRPAQAGGHCQGEDEAEAQRHLHGCGETEQTFKRGIILGFLTERGKRGKEVLCSCWDFELV